jgi:hypothetical protein
MNLFRFLLGWLPARCHGCHCTVWRRNLIEDCGKLLCPYCQRDAIGGRNG